MLNVRERVEKFITDLKKQDIVQENVNLEDVYSILWKSCMIIINWDGTKSCQKFIKKTKLENADLISGWCFVKGTYMNSSKIVFYLRPQYSGGYKEIVK